MTAGGGAPREEGPDGGDEPPEFGAPYLGGYGVPARKAGTNPLAIFALVSSVVGVLAVGVVGSAGSVLGIVLGTVALIQIKRSPQGGHGAAVAAIVVGFAAILVSLVLRVVTLNT